MSPQHILWGRSMAIWEHGYLGVWLFSGGSHPPPLPEPKQINHGIVLLASSSGHFPISRSTFLTTYVTFEPHKESRRRLGTTGTSSHCKVDSIMMYGLSFSNYGNVPMCVFASFVSTHADQWHWFSSELLLAFMIL